MFSFLFRKRAIPATSLSVATVTDRGLVRKDNQDFFLSRPQDGLLCVADGMGGGDGGALASRWTCEAIGSACAPGLALAELADRVEQGLQDANGRIRAHMKEKGYRMMGSTAVVVLADLSGNGEGWLCHAGDSRAYRMRGGVLSLLTADHTVGGELGRSLSGRSDPQGDMLQARSNPLSHILTRAVGTEFRVRPDWQRIDVQRGDRYLLCSDGVHDMLADDEIGGILRKARTPQAAVDALGASVRAAGAMDNYTMICAFAGGGRSRNPPPRAQSGEG